MRGHLLDLDGRAFAQVEVHATGDLHRGTLFWLVDDPELMALWSQFEDAVEGQCLVEVDRLDQIIEAMQIRWVTEDGRDVPVSDLQVHPTTSAVSFRARQP